MVYFFSLTKFFKARTLISYKLTIHFSSFSSINIEQLTTFYYTLRLFSKIIVCSGWWTSLSLTKYYRAKCFFVFHQPSNRDLTDSIPLMSVQNWSSVSKHGVESNSKMSWNTKCFYSWPLSCPYELSMCSSMCRVWS